MLQVKDLTYRKILKNISFSLKKNSCVSIVGKNGSGKSTLLKCIAGIIKDFEGSVKIEGIDLNSLSSKEIASIVSYVPQLIEKRIELKVKEFLELSLYPYSIKFTDEEKKTKVFEVAEKMEIENLLDRRVCNLSGGEVQKVLISGAVLQGADILLLDEPTSHLDIYRKKEIMNFISGLRNMGKTIIFVSHNLDEVRDISDRVLVLKDGEIVKEIEKGGIEIIFETQFLEFVYA